MKKRSQGRAAHRIATAGVLTLSVAGAGILGSEIFQEATASKVAGSSSVDSESSETSSKTTSPYVQQNTQKKVTGRSSGS